MKIETLQPREFSTSVPGAHASAPVVLQKPRILLADDSPEIRESLGKLLRTSGYHVTLAAHGRHVLDQALNEDFDLLLLDLNMPEIDGWDALDHLATLKPTLPVIIITAQPDQHDWARAEGARALMEKPLDLPLLLKTIQEIMSSQTPPCPGLNRAPSSGGFRFDAPVKSDFSFSNPGQRWGAS